MSSTRSAEDRNHFIATRKTVWALGFDERFVWVREFYLACCKADFTERNTDPVQYTFKKPTT